LQVFLAVNLQLLPLSQITCHFAFVEVKDA
jgi:hypothetical protein